MKRQQLAVWLAGVVLVVAAGSTWARTRGGYAIDGGDPAHNVVPVLVSVDNAGKITDMSTPEKLRPDISRLLRQSLDQLVTGPAYDKQGHGVASQAIFNMGVKSTTRDDGKVDMRFVYVSAKSVPLGHYRWVFHNDRYSLANSDLDRAYQTRIRDQQNQWYQLYLQTRRQHGNNSTSGSGK